MVITLDEPSRVRLAEADPTTSVAWRAPLFAPLAVAGAAAVGALLVRAVDPGVPGHYPVCPFLAVTGMYCPFCGGLRAVHALMHGDVTTAFGMNPLVMVGLLILVLAWWRWARRSVQGIRVNPRVAAWPAWVTLAVIAAFWAARNVPALQGWLAP
jgi:hypothetical protein